MLTHLPLVNFNIMNESVLLQAGRQAPAAQDAAGACRFGDYNRLFNYNYNFITII